MTSMSVPSWPRAQSSWALLMAKMPSAVHATHVSQLRKRCPGGHALVNASGLRNRKQSALASYPKTRIK